jgi:hypothetical protein
VPAPTVPLSGVPNTLSSLNAAGDDYFQSVTGPLRTHVFTNFTIEAYINFTVKDNGWQTIIGRDDVGNEDGQIQSLLYFGVSANNSGAPITGGAFRMEVLNGGAEPASTNLQVNSTFVPVVNQWYHVAGAGDSTKGTIELFVNGISVGSTAGFTQMYNPASDSSWTIGRGQFNGNPVDFVRGYIDEVRISDTALTPAQFLGKFEDKLVLVVNKSNGPDAGKVSIRNVSPNPITIDYYQVTSPDADNAPGGTPGGALDTVGWSSLDDRGVDAGLAADFDGVGGVGAGDLTVWRNAFGVNANGDANGDGQTDGDDLMIWQQQLGQTAGIGDSWDEATSSSRTAVGELFLNGGTTILPGAANQISLGALFDETSFGVGNDGNLVFRYGVKGDNNLQAGGVQYVLTGPAVSVPEPTTLFGAALALTALFGRGRRRTA